MPRPLLVREMLRMRRSATRPVQLAVQRRLPYGGGHRHGEGGGAGYGGRRGRWRQRRQQSWHRSNGASAQSATPADPSQGRGGWPIIPPARPRLRRTCGPKPSRKERGGRAAREVTAPEEERVLQYCLGFVHRKPLLWCATPRHPTPPLPTALNARPPPLPGAWRAPPGRIQRTVASRGPPPITMTAAWSSTLPISAHSQCTTVWSGSQR